MTRSNKFQLIHLSLFLILFFCSFQTSTFGQLQFPEKTELFRDDVVPRVDILIDQESLDYILDPENRESDELFDATFIFSNGTVLDTLENIGFRLRGNTSRSAKKKSFKIDINEFVPGRRYYGVTKINLNGQHNDPTSARAKICADLGDLFEIPSMRTNHVELYINGEYRGLYTNVEHIDQNYVKKRFGNKNGNLYKCLYPADLNYKGDDPSKYKEVIYGRRNYDLKSNTETDDYSDFANFVRVLNLTSDANFVCEIEKVFNVDLYIKCIIFDILTGNWDGPIYNKNNFYLYHNQATDKFEYIPYDVDNTLGIDWLNKDWGNRNIYTWSQTNEVRPLYNRIIETQEYRDRFSYYMQEILLNIYNEAELYPYLDEMRDRLKEFIEDDEYYTMDYGFDLGYFEDGFEYELPFYQTDYGIKSFIQTRLIASFTQLEMNDISPVITNRRNNHPNQSENIEIQANIIDDNEIMGVELCYRINGGPEICAPMMDNGTQNDGEANDGLYGVILAAPQQSGVINYVIKALDNADNLSMSPRCSGQNITIEDEVLQLSINEFMASNNSIITDVRNEYDDWVEIYNYGSTPIYLGDKYLSDNPDNPDKWSMPNYTIEAGEYLLFWADDDRNQGTFHTNFKLSKGGEYIGIYDDDATSNQLIDGIEFGSQISDISFGRLPNGTGDFTKLVPTPGAPNETISTNLAEEELPEISVYPNPTYNWIFIQSNKEISDLKLYNAMGNEIDVSYQTGDRLQLSETSGIYYIQIFTNNRIPITRKIIKI